MQAEKQIQVIRANGDIEVLSGPPTLAEMQNIVGGYIEHVRVLGEINREGDFIYTSMYVNETGLLDGLPRNEKATEIYQRNIRAQFPDAENPCRAADAAYRKHVGNAKIIDIRPVKSDEYDDDPWIVGDAIYFKGYTCEEADAALNEAADKVALSMTTGGRK